MASETQCHDLLAVDWVLEARLPPSGHVSMALPQVLTTNMEKGVGDTIEY